MPITVDVVGDTISLTATSDVSHISINLDREAPPVSTGLTLVGKGGNGAVGGVDVALSLPAVQAGDVIYVWGGHWVRSGDVFGPLTGFAPLVDQVVGTVWRAGLWKKVADGSEAIVTCGGSHNSLDGAAYGFYVLRNVGSETSAVINGTTGNPNPPAVTTNVDKALVLALTSSNFPDDDPGTPSGYENLVVAVANASSNKSGAAGATKEVSPAGVEDPAWPGYSATSRWQAISLIVRPA